MSTGNKRRRPNSEDAVQKRSNSLCKEVCYTYIDSTRITSYAVAMTTAHINAHPLLRTTSMASQVGMQSLVIHSTDSEQKPLSRL
ncbi:hypothetical protein N0V82_005863 [Gnomoniopsis sp. IMI 355080]|nr:hypothetical protein N0V82_005863 [Gnomoniopsis sp. IMI 355080]